MSGDWRWLIDPIFHRLDGVLSIVIFGSFARGDVKEGSDLDVLIVVKDLQEEDRLKLSAILSRSIEPPSGFPRPASPVVLTADEVKKHPPILLDMIEDSIIVYDEGNFMKRILEDLKEKLSEIGAKKVKTEEGWYWILKPDTELGEVVEI